MRWRRCSTASRRRTCRWPKQPATPAPPPSTCRPSSSPPAPWRQPIAHPRDIAPHPSPCPAGTVRIAASINPDRQKVIDALKDAVTLAGNGAHGKEIFTKTCATCHHLADVGNAVGPDLASVGDKSSASLIVSILDPNRAVDPKFTA